MARERREEARGLSRWLGTRDLVILVAVCGVAFVGVIVAMQNHREDRERNQQSRDDAQRIVDENSRRRP